MKLSDYIKALAVAISIIVITMAASFPMVAFYAYLIEPGHPEEFYTAAAQWIAPWSSYILGPIAFFGFNYWLSRGLLERNVMQFAAATIILYLVVDLSILPILGLPLFSAITLAFGLSLTIKTVAAFLGAYLGSQKHTFQESQGMPGDQD